MIRTSHITNLGNSIPNLLIEPSIKSFIASHETIEGRSINKRDISIISIFPVTNNESTYYRVTWSID
ncbi:MAG: hypothetical protein ACK40G_01430 [Cytophagaceae bacterium]